MITLNKEIPSKKVYRVESLNPEKGISTSLRINPAEKEYVVCLCLTHKIVQTSFPTEQAAYTQMKKYRQLYKQIKNNNQ